MNRYANLILLVFEIDIIAARFDRLINQLN